MEFQIFSGMQQFSDFNNKKESSLCFTPGLCHIKYHGVERRLILFLLNAFLLPFPIGPIVDRKASRPILMIRVL